MLVSELPVLHLFVLLPMLMIVYKILDPILDVVLEPYKYFWIRLWGKRHGLNNSGLFD